MRIIIETIPLKDMRYFSLGDYFYDEKGDLIIRIVETGNDDLNFCIALHEFIEEKLTRKHGIKEEDILKFDLWVEEEVKAGRYPDDGEPGDHPKSIYVKEHRFAENIERLLAHELGINWENYNNEINTIL